MKSRSSQTARNHARGCWRRRRAVTVVVVGPERPWLRSALRWGSRGATSVVQRAPRAANHGVVQHVQCFMGGTPRGRRVQSAMRRRAGAGGWPWALSRASRARVRCPTRRMATLVMWCGRVDGGAAAAAPYERAVGAKAVWAPAGGGVSVEGDSCRVKTGAVLGQSHVRAEVDLGAESTPVDLGSTRRLGQSVCAQASLRTGAQPGSTAHLAGCGPLAPRSNPAACCKLAGGPAAGTQQ